MTGKERIFATLRGEKTDKTPWVPFAGSHAGKLKGYTAREVATDYDKLIESLKEVNKLYRPDGQPVMFDLQIEAEILGCDLVWSEDAPPSVGSHPLEGDEPEDLEIPTRIPGKDEGRLPLELKAIAEAKKLFPDTAIYAVCTGPFTLASHLRGTDIFMDMILEPDVVKELLAYTNNVCKAVTSYLIEAGADVIAVTDPLISQISPDHFAEFMHEPFSELFAHIKKEGAFSAFFVCGNATRNVEPMCLTKPDAISVDENVNLAKAKEITDKYGLTICGNIPLTSVMLFGTMQDNIVHTLGMLDSVDASHHYIVSPGCDMPYATPVENAEAVELAVHDTEKAKTIVANYKKENIKFEGTLPDYEHLEKPLVEVFTLDSLSCAACTYMWAAAKDAVEALDNYPDIVEYKYTELQNIARCQVMGVAQLPSIYINGKLAFSSIIPSREELVAKIKEYYK